MAGPAPVRFFFPLGGPVYLPLLCPPPPPARAKGSFLCGGKSLFRSYCYVSLSLPHDTCAYRTPEGRATALAGPGRYPYTYIQLHAMYAG